MKVFVVHKDDIIYGTFEDIRVAVKCQSDKQKERIIMGNLDEKVIISPQDVQSEYK